MSEYEIKSTWDNQTEVRDAIHPLGIVSQIWKDGTFNFKCYDNECEDEMVEILEEMEVECKLI